MFRDFAIPAVLLGLLVSGNAQASKPSEEGWDLFGVGFASPDHLAPDGSWRMTVWAWSESDPLHGSIATVRLDPGPGLECAAEYRSKIVPLDPSGAGTTHWSVKLTSTGDGPRHISATIRIGRPGGPAIDEKKILLGATIHEGSVHVDRQETIYATRVERGQRFRYGGAYLVAIDDSEKARPLIDTRPSVRQEFAGRCLPCAADSDRVDLVVTVGRNGRVTWIQPRKPWMPQIAPELLKAAIDGAKRWRFEPARSHGKPVADWATISVIVRRS